jgi:hypothetical protein
MQIISTSPLLNGAVRNREVGLKSRSLAYRGASVAINHLVDNARHIWPLIGEPFTASITDSCTATKYRKCYEELDPSRRIGGTSR